MAHAKKFVLPFLALAISQAVTLTSAIAATAVTPRATATATPVVGARAVTPPHGNRGACNLCHGSKYGTNGNVSTTPVVAPTPTPTASTYIRTVRRPHGDRGACTKCHGSKFGTDGTVLRQPARLGRRVYVNRCSSCHTIGKYDAVGTAPSLTGDSALVGEMFDPGIRGHEGIKLTRSKIASLQKFLIAAPALPAAPKLNTTPPTPATPVSGTKTITPPHGSRGACNQCHGTKYGTNGVIPATTAPAATPRPTTTPAPVVTTPAPTPTPAAALDGAALYQKNCAGCHGASKRGKSVTATSNAIKNNVGGMGYLKTLTAAELDAIAKY